MDNRNIKSRINPLYKYDELLKDGAIQKHLATYIYDMKMDSGTPTGGENFEFMFASDVPYYDGEVIVTTRTFGERLNKFFDQAYLYCKDKMDERILFLANIEAKQQYLISVLDGISQLKDISDNIESFGNNELIKTWITKLIEYINSRYKSVRVDHHLFNELEVFTEPSRLGYFKFAYGLKGINKLYTILRELEFLSDEPDEKSKLHNIISSHDPKSLKNPIKITCDAEKASYIFFKMKFYFTDFTTKKIIASESFLTSHGKPFSESSIYTAKSRLRADVTKSEVMDEVDLAFEQFNK